MKRGGWVSRNADCAYYALKDIPWTSVATDNIQTIWPQSPLKCKPLNRVVRTCWTRCYPLTISTASYAERCTCCLELGYPNMPAGICICFDAKEQQLYTDLSLDVWAPQPVSKAKARCCTEEPLYQPLGSMTLSLQSLSRAHDHRGWSELTQAGKSRALSCDFFLTTLVTYSFTSDATQTTCPSPASQHS